jgi:hypothetical protein
MVRVFIRGQMVDGTTENGPTGTRKEMESMSRQMALKFLKITNSQ